jgi:prepilin-type N-terminal cleavage/methylation domain-containing protein
MRNSRAFTLVELLAVVGILAVLISLIVPSYQKLLGKVDRVVCMSHLRSLWLAFAPCASGDGAWPQLPKDIKIGSRQEQEWWVETARTSLDVNPRTWICPTVARSFHSKPTDAPVIDYMPTLFDARPGTPNRWPSMPWFTEIGNVHGDGNLAVRSDGSIVPLLPK